MLRSMTAYGRASLTTPLGRFVAELQSVNRKYLEITAVLPKELARFEIDIKKFLGESITRGQVTLKLFVYFDAGVPFLVTPNLPLIRQIKGAWDQIIEDLNLEQKQEVFLELLAKESGVLIYGENAQEEGEYLATIKELLSAVLKPFLKMKEEEGSLLQSDISHRLVSLQRWIDQVASRSQGATVKYRQKLQARLEEVLSGAIENEERILREICIYAERIDISEEITRFRSHLQQFSHLLNASESCIGKTLDFLVQEMNREVNTIGSKSSDIEIARLVIEIKGEIEKIREQIQNVE